MHIRSLKIESWDFWELIKKIDNIRMLASGDIDLKIIYHASGTKSELLKISVLEAEVSSLTEVFEISILFDEKPLDIETFASE